MCFQRLEYQTKGRESWDRAWEVLQTTTGWKDGGGTDQKTTGKVSYQTFPDIGKVFKLEVGDTNPFATVTIMYYPFKDSMSLKKKTYVIIRHQCSPSGSCQPYKSASTL